MLEPPGTIRTPCAGVSLFTGNVDLSKKGWRTVSIDISMTVPIRNPSRMPFFTHGFTRQPNFDAGSGSAARTEPEFRASRNAWKIWKCSLEYGADEVSKSSSTCSGSMDLLNEPERCE